MSKDDPNRTVFSSEKSDAMFQHPPTLTDPLDLAALAEMMNGQHVKQECMVSFESDHGGCDIKLPLETIVWPNGVLSTVRISLLAEDYYKVQSLYQYFTKLFGKMKVEHRKEHDSYVKGDWAPFDAEASGEKLRAQLATMSMAIDEVSPSYLSQWTTGS